MPDEKIYLGVVIVLYQKIGGENLYVVVENQTGKITFPAGAQEDYDNTLLDTARREAKEELGLNPEDYRLISSNVSYEFIFGPQKKERAGAKGIYTIFTGEINPDIKVMPTSELKSIKLLKARAALEAVSFADLKEAVANILS